MKNRYTVATDAEEAYNNFHRNTFVSNTINELIALIAQTAAHRGYRPGAYKNYRIYKATITPGEKVVRHRVWVDKPIPTTGIACVTWDAINVREPFPPREASWIQGYNTVEAALKEALAVKNDISMWKVFPIVGVYENEADNISVSLVE